MPRSMPLSTEQIRDRLHQARHVVVFSGAGMSAESGVPTFRDAQTGLWAHFSPEDLATPEAFERQPEVVWNWYAWRRELVGRAEPHAGHLALVELERQIPRLTIVTQNVDGLHQRAGSKHVLELHGNILRTVCSECRRPVEQWTDDSVPPRCPDCHGRLRPDVVWFGEMPYRMDEIVKLLMKADLFISIGTSGNVYPAAGFVAEAGAAGAHTVELNLEPSEGVSFFAEAIYGPATKVVPAYVELLLSGK